MSQAFVLRDENCADSLEVGSGEPVRVPPRKALIAARFVAWHHEGWAGFSTVNGVPTADWERLAKLDLSAEALHRFLLDLVTEFCGGEFEDDATVLVVAVS